MSNRLVNLQRQLRALEDDVERALRTLLRLVQRYTFLGDAACILQQLELVDQFVAFVLPLSTERTGIGTLLNIAPGKGICGVTSSRRVLGLVDIAAFRGKKPLFLPMEVH